MALIFVDCEAAGACPLTGQLTEFGAVEYAARLSFHGRILATTPDPKNPAIPVPTGEVIEAPELVFRRFDAWLAKLKPPLVFVSDNPAYDWQWINCGFHQHLGRNPFGFSARRIGDFYAGLKGDWYTKQRWKGLRVTPHTHNPVDDAMGNAEAFERLLRGERP